MLEIVEKVQLVLPFRQGPLQLILTEETDSKSGLLPKSRNLIGGRLKCFGSIDGINFSKGLKMAIVFCASSSTVIERSINFETDVATVFYRSGSCPSCCRIVTWSLRSEHFSFDSQMYFPSRKIREFTCVHIRNFGAFWCFRII
jgi:hypothetical protein